MGEANTANIESAYKSSSDAYRRLRFVASVQEQFVNMLLVVENYKVNWIESLEYDTSAGLEIIEEQQLISCGKVFSYGLNDGGGRKVGPIYMGAINNNRNLSTDCFLCYEISYKINRWKNKATIGRNH